MTVAITLQTFSLTFLTVNIQYDTSPVTQWKSKVYLPVAIWKHFMSGCSSQKDPEKQGVQLGVTCLWLRNSCP